jgi:hypothetical protein
MLPPPDIQSGRIKLNVRDSSVTPVHTYRCKWRCATEHSLIITKIAHISVLSVADRWIKTHQVHKQQQLLHEVFNVNRSTSQQNAQILNKFPFIFVPPLTFGHKKTAAVRIALQPPVQFSRTSST